MEPETKTPETTSAKEKKSSLMILMVIIILLLAGLVAYLYSKPVTTKTTETKETTQTEESAETQTTGTEAGTQTGTQTGTQPGGAVTTSTKADIDGDLKSLDALDLSKIENDYGEDTVNDLTQ